MKMQHVQYFLALCEERNFTRAALRCRVTQPTLTQAIKQLEAELGGALFERNGRTSSLTALGAAVRPHIAAVAAASERVRETAAVVGAGAPPLPSAFIGPSQARVMRKVIVLAAAAIALLLAAGTLKPLLYPATAEQSAAAGKASDVSSIEKTVGIRHLSLIEPHSDE
jgi:DNA-binding transcriptional LysR family regulator